MLDNTARRELDELFGVLRSCCLHDPQWLPDDVEDELKWVGDRESCPESESFVIVSLKDGTFGLLTQSEDYSGHGCQCDSMTVREPTLSKLLMHLQDWEIERLLKKNEYE